MEATIFSSGSRSHVVEENRWAIAAGCEADSVADHDHGDDPEFLDFAQ